MLLAHELCLCRREEAGAFAQRRVGKERATQFAGEDGAAASREGGPRVLPPEDGAVA